MANPQSQLSLQQRRVIPFKEWCALNSISQATGRRLIAAGKVRVTRLSERRIGIREDHNAEFQDGAARRHQ